jgi:hypothetical protein
VAGWTNEELERVGGAEELELASRRPDGSLRNPVTIWVVRVGDDLYVRSVDGRSSKWFSGVQDRHQGRISAGGVERDARFVETDEAADEIDDAYRTKYRDQPAAFVDPMTRPEARAATLKLLPQ